MNMDYELVIEMFNSEFLNSKVLFELKFFILNRLN